MRPPLLALLILGAAVAGCGGDARSQGATTLVLERTIELPGVEGRLDHLAVDVAHRRLFVAALGNGSVEAVDLDNGRIANRVAGLKEPQGLGYLPARDELVVASGDGAVRFYRGTDLSPTGSLKLGDDADNVRIDAGSGLVIVGYGAGALASIDPISRKVVSNLPLAAHPESFRLDPAHHRVFVNLPGAGQMAVGDLSTGKVVATRKAAHAAGYPMLFDAAANVVAVVYRLPARLVISDADSGQVSQDIEVCGDADDLFLDARRRRIYVSCGGGAVDVLERAQGGYRRIERVRTRSGARTSLFVPELDRLYVAARAADGKAAAILVFKPG